MEIMRRVQMLVLMGASSLAGALGAQTATPVPTQNCDRVTQSSGVRGSILVFSPCAASGDGTNAASPAASTSSGVFLLPPQVPNSSGGNRIQLAVPNNPAAPQLQGGTVNVPTQLRPNATSTMCHDGTATGMVACTATFTENFDKGYLDPAVWSNSYDSFETFNSDRPVWMPDTFDFIPGGGLRIRADNRVITFPNGIPDYTDECAPNYSTTKCFTSGAITTQGSFSQAYGYFEISTQLYPGPGVFPAFWMVPETSYPDSTTLPTTPGPAISEIDIMEFNTTYLDNAWFGQSGSNGHASLGEYSYDTGLTTFNPTTGYHTYGMAWTPTTLSFYYDGTLSKSYSTGSQVGVPMYLLVDADLGGPGGAPTSSTVFPQFMNVAYVHAFQYQNEQAGMNNGVDFGRARISQETINAGDTLTFTSSFINNSIYTLGGTVTGDGPHIGVSVEDYMHQNSYLTGTPSVYNISAPMAPGATVPLSLTWTTPTSLPAGVYAVNWGATVSPSFGYTIQEALGSPSRFTVVTNPLLNLMSLNFKPVSSKPYSGNVTYSNGGLTMELAGNMWQAASYTYTVLPATMLEFDFSSTGTADTYAIGLFPSANYTQTAAQRYLFQFAGGVPLGQQSFDHYLNSDGTTHYRIPIGDYYTGSMSDLVIASSSGALTANATFSNVRIYELPTTLY